MGTENKTNDLEIAQFRLKRDRAKGYSIVGILKEDILAGKFGYEDLGTTEEELNHLERAGAIKRARSLFFLLRAGRLRSARSFDRLPRMLETFGLIFENIGITEEEFSSYRELITNQKDSEYDELFKLQEEWAIKRFIITIH